MSDAAFAFWKAFSMHFDTSETVRQVCCWHIWRAWTTKLALISSGVHRKRARAGLRLLARLAMQNDSCCRHLLFSSHTAEIFRENYELVVNRMLAGDECFAAFTAYFIANYPAESGVEWAAFGRIGSDISCNMHIESYHRYDCP